MNDFESKFSIYTYGNTKFSLEAEIQVRNWFVGEDGTEDNIPEVVRETAFSRNSIP